MKKNIWLGVCILGVVVSTASFAEDALLLGIEAGNLWVDDAQYEGSSPSTQQLGLFIGWQRDEHWRWELGYQYVSQVDASLTGVTLDNHFIDIASRYEYALTSDFGLFGRVGMAYWVMEKTLQSGHAVDSSGFSPFFGMGAFYELTPALQVSLGYQFIHKVGGDYSGQYDGHSALLELAWRYGASASSTTGAVEPVSPIQESSTDIEIAEADAPIVPVPRSLLLWESTFLFPFDKSQLMVDVDHRLLPFVDLLLAYPNARLRIVGHADSAGATPYNEALSKQRANTVAQRLALLGADAERIDVAWQGEMSPINDNATKQGQALNRRVEVSIYYINNNWK